MVGEVQYNNSEQQLSAMAMKNCSGMERQPTFDHSAVLFQLPTPL